MLSGRELVGSRGRPGERSVTTVQKACEPLAWVCDVDLETLHKGELDFLRDVYISIVVVAPLVAVAGLRADLEEHDVLKVLFVDQRLDLFEDTGQRIHHDKERQHAFDEPFADVELTSLNFDVQLPVAEVFECLKRSRHL